MGFIGDADAMVFADLVPLAPLSPCVLRIHARTRGSMRLVLTAPQLLLRLLAEGLCSGGCGGMKHVLACLQICSDLLTRLEPVSSGAIDQI